MHYNIYRSWTLFTGGCVRACAFYIRYFDVGETIWQMVFSSGRYIFCSSPHTCKTEMAKNTRARAVHRSKSLQAVVATRADWFPWKTEIIFTIFYIFRTCHCRAAALGTILLCVHHIIFAWHNNIYKYIWYTTCAYYYII